MFDRNPKIKRKHVPEGLLSWKKNKERKGVQCQFFQGESGEGAVVVENNVIIIKNIFAGSSLLLYRGT